MSSHLDPAITASVDASIEATPDSSIDSPVNLPTGSDAPVVPPEDPEAEARIRHLVRTLTVTVFLQWMGATAIVPLLPLYVRSLGGSDAMAGVVMASFFATGVLFQYPIGRLTDRVGRRPILLGGLVAYGVASFLFLAPINPIEAVILRGIQGLGAGGAAVAALAMISGGVPADRRGRAFGSVYAGELSGMAIGPLVGCVLGNHYFWAMFLLSGVVALSACVPAWRLDDTPYEEQSHARKKSRAHSDEAGRPTGSSVSSPRRDRLSPLVWHPAMVGALITGAALGFAIGVYDICWTLLLVSRGASDLVIGISWTLFAIPFVVASKPSGWLADHMDRRYLVLGGIGVSAALCAIYPFVANYWYLILLAAFEAVGFSLVFPASQSLLTQGAEPDQVGRIQGILASSTTAATAVAAAGAGAAFAWSHWLPFGIASVVVFVALAVAGVVWHKVPGRVNALENHPFTEEHPGLDTLGVSLAQAPAATRSEVQ